jgi:hypothetical protein
MEQQLELFDALPTAPRLPRRLRRLGFELQLVRGDIARLEELHRKLDQDFVELAAVVAESKADGRVIPRAYAVAVEADGAREELVGKLNDAHDLARGLDRLLANGIERRLRHDAAQRMAARA